MRITHRWSLLNDQLMKSSLPPYNLVMLTDDSFHWSTADVVLSNVF